MITRALPGLRTSYSTWLLAMTSSQITQSRSVAFLKKPADTGTHEIGVRRHDTLALAFDNDGKAGCGLGGMIAHSGCVALHACAPE
jgi:hypothetical protein